jgi:hypothetical protein
MKRLLFVLLLLALASVQSKAQCHLADYVRHESFKFMLESMLTEAVFAAAVCNNVINATAANKILGGMIEAGVYDRTMMQRLIEKHRRARDSLILRRSLSHKF